MDGPPPNPGGWLTTTATRKALDRIRREKVRDTKYAEAAMITDDTPPEPTGPVEDDRLRLIFTCCHPALAPENRVALTLRLLGGLTVAEIAHAFLVPETTMAQRITRAKQKIKNANIPYRVPSAADLPTRIATVLSVLYLVFNEGYLASGAEADPVREDLCARGDPADPAAARGGRRAGPAAGGGRAARADAADSRPGAPPGCPTAPSSCSATRTGPAGTPR